MEMKIKKLIENIIGEIDYDYYKEYVRGEFSESFDENVTKLLEKFAESRVKKYRDFITSFLNPEERGLAVSKSVRDDVREFLGRKRVESEPIPERIICGKCMMPTCGWH